MKCNYENHNDSIFNHGICVACDGTKKEYMKKPNYLDGYAKDVCGFCSLKRTPEGHDGCIGTLPNVMNACCGHGQANVAYVQFNHDDYKNNPNKHLIKGEEALKYIRENKSI